MKTRVNANIVISNEPMAEGIVLDCNINKMPYCAKFAIEELMAIDTEYVIYNGKKTLKIDAIKNIKLLDATAKKCDKIYFKMLLAK